MAKFSDTQSLKHNKPAKEMLIKQGKNGEWLGVTLSEEAAYRVKSESAERIDKYFDACFKNELKESPEVINRDRFYALFKKTDCLMCSDSGLITMMITRNNGRAYETGYACTCQSGVPWLNSTGSMSAFHSQEYKHPCQLAGEASQCFFDTACSKKRPEVDCPKFPKAY